MISTAPDLASNLVLDLPPMFAQLWNRISFDGESVFKTSAALQNEAPGSGGDDRRRPGVDADGAAESGRPGRWRRDLTWVQRHHRNKFP